jgi:hypothetical protein
MKGASENVFILPNSQPAEWDNFLQDLQPLKTVKIEVGKQNADLQ